jgi:hypothetical protein
MEQQTRLSKSDILAALLLLAASPLTAQTSRPESLPAAERLCQAALADGTSYEVWDRVLLKEWEGKPLYVKIRAYYRPGPGELLWRSTAYSKEGYASARKEGQKDPGGSCEDPYRHILLSQGGEWADFWADRGKITVFHSTLKFSTREEAWSHIAEHWQDAADDPKPSTKWVSEIVLYDRLGREFFRPKRLEFDARPYSYDSLVGVKKVGDNWELELKGADEPNRATVLLDSKFRIVKIEKNTPSR